jgi:hypothetical protein
MTPEERVIDFLAHERSNVSRHVLAHDLAAVDRFAEGERRDEQQWANIITEMLFRGTLRQDARGVYCDGSAKHEAIKVERKKPQRGKPASGQQELF